MVDDVQDKMAYRWSDIDGQSDGRIMGLMGGVTDRHVNDKLTVWHTDWSYDGWMGMMDRLAVSWTDSATDGWVDLQTEQITSGQERSRKCRIT